MLIIAVFLQTGYSPTKKEILDIATSLAEGMAVLHGKEVIHRDLKPANLFLLPGPRIKIFDLGDAAIKSADLREVKGTIGCAHELLWSN